MLDDIVPIDLFNFLEIAIDCPKFLSKTKLLDKKYKIPSVQKHLNNKEFFQIHFAWDKKGLYFHFFIKEMFQKAFADFRRGDSIELFIDTRNLKTKGYTTKFCHHFVIYPQRVQRTLAKEVTRFRSDDMHKLCDPNEIDVKVQFQSKSYFMDVFIPENCLYGFDPIEIKTFGFTYRINSFDSYPQYYSVSSEEYNIEKNPYLWASVNLIE